MYEGTRDLNEIKKSLDHVVVPTFVPKKGVKINTDENAKDKKEEPEPVAEDDEEQTRKLLVEIPPANKLAGFKLTVIEFEKVFLMILLITFSRMLTPTSILTSSLLQQISELAT